MRSFFLLALAHSLLALALPASAQIEPGDRFSHLMMGVAVPLTDINLSYVGGTKDRIGAPGISSGAKYIYHATKHIAVGIDVVGMRFSDIKHDLPLFTASSGGSLFTAMPFGRLTAFPGFRVSPFIFGGFGMNYFSANVTARPIGGNAWADTGTVEERLLLDASSVGFAIAAGGGIEVYLWEHLTIGVETRWSHNSINREKFGSNGINAITTMSRVGWRF